MKVGDVVKCINNDRCYGLELGRSYTISSFDSFGDPGFKKGEDITYYLSWRFIIDIKETRKQKLKKLKYV